jgi:hypothetical protein
MLQIIPEATGVEMLSDDDIDRLLVIGEQQRAELLGQGSDRAQADAPMVPDHGPEGNARGDGA